MSERNYLDSEKIALGLCEKPRFEENNVCVLEDLPLDIDDLNSSWWYDIKRAIIINVWNERDTVWASCFKIIRVTFTIVWEPLCDRLREIKEIECILRDCLESRDKNNTDQENPPIRNFDGFCVHWIKFTGNAIRDRYVWNRVCIELPFDFYIRRNDCF